MHFLIEVCFNFTHNGKLHIRCYIRTEKKVKILWQRIHFLENKSILRYQNKNLFSQKIVFSQNKTKCSLYQIQRLIQKSDKFFFTKINFHLDIQMFVDFGGNKSFSHKVSAFFFLCVATNVAVWKQNLNVHTIYAKLVCIWIAWDLDATVYIFKLYALIQNTSLIQVNIMYNHVNIYSKWCIQFSV